MTLLPTDALDNALLAASRRQGEAPNNRYLPFGAHTSLAQAHTAFHGQYNEQPLDGYLLGNGYRLYLPRLMRFAQADQLSPFDKGGVNAYAFCVGDPVNRQDIDGRSSFFKHARRLFKIKTKIKFKPDAKFPQFIGQFENPNNVLLIKNKKIARIALDEEIKIVNKNLKESVNLGKYQLFDAHAKYLTDLATQLKVEPSSFKKRLEDARLNKHVVWASART